MFQLSSILSSLSAWDWADIAGVSLVFIGVAGEVIVSRITFRSSSAELKAAARSEDISALEALTENAETKKALWESKIRRWEYKFQAILVIGLAIELIAMPYHIKEGARLKREAEELKKSNLELALKLQPRTISSEQKRRLAAFFIQLPKTNVLINVLPAVADGQPLAKDLTNVFAMSGFAHVQATRILNLGDLHSPVTGIGVGVEGEPNSSLTLSVVKALNSIGLPANKYFGEVNHPGWLYIEVGNR